MMQHMSDVTSFTVVREREMRTFLWLSHNSEKATVVREIVCETFRVKHFRAEVFLWSGPIMKYFLPTKFYTR